MGRVEAGKNTDSKIVEGLECQAEPSDLYPMNSQVCGRF